jgi:hypothetical protein
MRRSRRATSSATPRSTVSGPSVAYPYTSTRYTSGARSAINQGIHCPATRDWSACPTVRWRPPV